MIRYKKILVTMMLLTAAAILFGSCAYRPKGVSAESTTAAPASTAQPEPTPTPAITHTVTYRMEGKTLSEEQVAEGTAPLHVPGFSDRNGILSWEDSGGAAVDVWNIPIMEDTVYDVQKTGPALNREGAIFAADTDGLFHPLNTFTRSDAVRLIYELLGKKPTGETFLKDVTTHARCWQAATTLVTAGYIQVDEAGKFYPDVAITPEDLSFMLEKLFSRGAVAAAMEGVSGELTRAQAAMILDKLLESPNAEQSPYFPDVSPDMDCYEAVEHLGIQGSISWVKGERAEPGFVNLEGYLYRVGEDGYFIRDTMVGTLYFDVTGQYTSGDEAVDSYVADIIDRNTKASMSREDMLRAVYDYVRDHYLYLKRSLYETGETGWELSEALKMFQTGKGNCYNFSGAFWSLARGVGYDAVCYAGLVGKDRDPHSWVEIEYDGVPYIFDVETEMSYRLVDDYITSMYKITYERGEIWSYVRDHAEAERLLAEKAAAQSA
ncbi:MAG: S-layer homology domain-containing protein [Oscillospiraceae bacterium]|nr:S-layer homology domain-containing protein [Oscillospiraceae bacterium]